MQEQATRESTSAIADLLIGKAAEYHGKSPQSSNDETDEAQVAPETVETENAVDRQPDPEQEQAADADQPETEDEEVSLKDLAEMLDVDVKDIYGVKLPLGNGETVSLGQYKDTYKRLQKYEADEEAFQENRRNQENQILVARQQAESLIDMLVSQGAMTPKNLEALENMQRSQLQRESKAIQAVIPSWTDPETRQRDYDAFAELGAEYGFSDVEIRAIGDHRILKMLYDFSAARRHAKKQNGKTPPKQIGGQSKQPKKVSTLAQRKRDARKHGGAVKQQLIADMITGKQPLE